jgi:hypothetical protein
VVWTAGIFTLGFRGFALIPALVVLGLLESRGRRPPGWVKVALAVALFIAIPLVRNVRDQGLRQRSIETAWGELQPLRGVAEMGGSLRPLVHTLVYLQSEPPRWGRTYWHSLNTIWPNLAQSWQGAPYIPLHELPPNHWLTAQADPEMYRSHGGLGFSAVAEPYMNFGAPGVVLYFWGLGAALSLMTRVASDRPLALAASAMVLGPLLWTTRNSFEVFFRPAAWGLLVVLILWLLSARAQPGLKAPVRSWQRNLPEHAHIGG